MLKDNAAGNRIPVSVIFHPSWWNSNCGICFDRDFFYDPECRVEMEQKMAQYLYERFGDLGLGRKNAEARPVVGPVHLAAGFVVSQLLGCEVKFRENASPDVICRNMGDEEIMRLSVPGLRENSSFGELVAMMDALEARYGYIEGDFNWSGIQNIALDLRGEQLFIDYFENPHLVKHLFDVISQTLVMFVKYVRGRTGTSSLTVNPSAGYFKPSVNLHSNCSISMISPETYEKYLLAYEKFLSENLQPYGIHHCGNNLHRFSESYRKVGGVSFYDVGWGADVKECREKLAGAFLNIRLSPVKMMSCSASEVERDILKSVQDNGGPENMGLCCINMDFGTPDENIRRIYQVAIHARTQCGRHLFL